MAEIIKHTKPESIWLFDYNSLLDCDDCPELMVFLSERDINILWQAIVNIDKFRSRVFTQVNGNNYTKATQDEFSEFKIWVSDLNVHLGDYPLCNDLLQQQNSIFEAMAEALNRLADCTCRQSSSAPTGTGGSRGSGTTQQPSVPYSETDDPDNPPEGFDDYASYREHKCNASTQIIQELISDLQTMALIDLATVVATELATTLAVTLLTPVPFDELLVAAVAVITGLLTGSYLLEISADMNTAFDDLVCDIYTGQDVATSISQLETSLDSIVDASSVPSLIAPYVKQVLHALVTTDSVNRAYSPVPISATGDCSACESTYWWSCLYGLVLDYDNDIVDVQATEDLYGGFVAYVGISVADDIYTTLLSGSITGNPEQPEKATIWYDTDDEDCVRTVWEPHIGLEPPPGVFGAFTDVTGILYRSGSSFTVRFDRS